MHKRIQYVGIAFLTIVLFAGCQSSVDTQAPVPTPEMTMEATVTEEPGEAVTPEATAMPEPTATPEATTPVPTETPEPTATSMPIATPEPTVTPEPTTTPMPTAIPEPTATPLPTATPKPTGTPTPVPTLKPLPSVSLSDYTFIEQERVGYANILRKDYTVTNECYVRSLPSIYGDVLGTVSVGDPLTVDAVCVETGWLRIDYKGETGYIRASHFWSGPMLEEPEVVPAWSREYTFTEMNTRMFHAGKKNVYLYTEPSPNAKKTDSYWNPDTWAVWVTGQCNETGWYRVDYWGTVAYVPEDALTAKETRTKLDYSPYPLDRWEDNGDSITFYQVMGSENETSFMVNNVLSTRQRFYTSLESTGIERLGEYREGTVAKQTISVVRGAFPVEWYPLYCVMGLEEWSRGFYIGGDDEAKIRALKEDVMSSMQYNLEQYGYSGLKETETFLGEFDEGPIYVYEVSAVK